MALFGSTAFGAITPEAVEAPYLSIIGTPGYVVVLGGNLLVGEAYHRINKIQSLAVQITICGMNYK